LPNMGESQCGTVNIAEQHRLQTHIVVWRCYPPVPAN
jgi:hypothetical protein